MNKSKVICITKWPLCCTARHGLRFLSCRGQTESSFQFHFSSRRIPEPDTVQYKQFDLCCTRGSTCVVRRDCYVSWRHCVTCIVTAFSVIKRRWMRWSGLITYVDITQAFVRYYCGMCTRHHGDTKRSAVSTGSLLSPSVQARCCDSSAGHSNLVHPVKAKANSNPQCLPNKNKSNKVQVITKHDLTLGKQRDGLWLMWSSCDVYTSLWNCKHTAEGKF